MYSFINLWIYFYKKQKKNSGSGVDEVFDEVEVLSDYINDLNNAALQDFVVVNTYSSCYVSRIVGEM